MKRSLYIPILMLAGLAVLAVALPGRKTSQPELSISGATPGLVSAQAYILPVANAGFSVTRDKSIPDPNIDASAAAIYDINSGNYLFDKNSDSRVPVASLTKIASALVVRDLMDLEAVVTVASGSIKVDGQKQTLYDGERLYVKDLLSMMLVESSNDAAYALASYARINGIDFVSEMNKKAQSLGMVNCSFTDPAGLDDHAYCTARDLVRLVRGVLRQYPSLWDITDHKELVINSVDGKISHPVKSTNELLWQMNGIIGGKTGNTEGALGCLILLVKIPEKDDILVSVVLGSRDRFGDTKALIDWVRRAYNWND